MNRSTVFLVGVIVVVVVALFAAMWYNDQQLPDNARIALNKYLNYRYPSPPTILQFVRASAPFRFDRSMSSVSFGDSNIFRATQDYRSQVVVNLAGDSATLTLRQDSLAYQPARPLPFPPTDTWCVVLKNVDEPAQAVVVAQHQDLYNADWFVHLPAGDQDAPLAAIGCDLKLAQ